MNRTRDQNESVVEHTVPSSVSPQRLDSYLASCTELGLSRNRIQRLLDDALITLNGKPANKKQQVKGGEVVVITLPPAIPTHLEGEDIPLDIAYEDDHLVVVNKPPGMVTHPAAGNYRGTLVNALIHHFGKLSELGGSDRPGIVHRLDKNTSGLLIVACDDAAFVALQQAIQTRQVKRTYLALVCGHMKEDSGTIDLPIGRSLKDRKRMTVTHHRSREAITGYKLLDRYRSYDLLEVNLHTGRTHQIRVHLSHLGHPVFGDPDYGGRHKWHRGVFAPERLLARRLLEIMPCQALHAARLEFTHPITQEKLTLHRDPPADFQALLDLLDKEGR